MARIEIPHDIDSDGPQDPIQKFGGLPSFPLGRVHTHICKHISSIIVRYLDVNKMIAELLFLKIYTTKMVYNKVHTINWCHAIMANKSSISKQKC